MIGALIVSDPQNELQNKPKVSEKIGSISALKRMISTFWCADVDKIYILTNEAQQMKKEAARMGAVFLPVPEDGTSFFDYIKSALSYLNGKVDQLFITPANVPLFTSETLRKLLVFSDPVVIPTKDGKSGYPLLIPSKAIPSILSSSGEASFRNALKKLQIPTQKVEVDDNGIFFYETNNKSFDSALKNHNLNQIHPEIRVRLRKEKSMFGPGSKLLLSLVHETSSLRTACDFMGISYSKGRSIINTLEEQLGTKVLTRQQGGGAGGSSTLTKEGVSLLEQYDKYQEDVRTYGEQIFAKYFDNLF